MADFSATISVGGTLSVWTDGATPPRTNPLPGMPHLYWSAPLVGTVRLSCTVGGVFEPLDAALGGRLFLWSWVARAAMIPIVSPAGQSSVATIGPFVLGQEGHYRVLCWRPDGGSTSISFLVE